MTPLKTQQPTKTIRGTWDEVLTHRDEIPITSEVELRVFDPHPARGETPTMALMRAWLDEDATDDPDELRAAEEDLRSFKQNMNLARKETGARLPYPEVE